MPVIAFHVAERASVTGTLHISSRLVAHRVMLLIDKRAQWGIRNIYAVGIYLEFRTRSAILEIIFAIVLSHVSTLCKWTKRDFVVIVHAEAFPAVFFRTEHHDVVNLTDGVEIIPVQFHCL